MSNNMFNTADAVVVGLINGRHPLPVSEYIFESIENVHDYEAICNTIWTFVQTRVGVDKAVGVGLNQADYTDIQVYRGKRALVVYVTGLTPVTAALVSICLRNGVSLTLMNYDTASQSYIPQYV